jgi:hypothetical protein
MDGPGTMYLGCFCFPWLLFVGWFSIVAIHPISYTIVKWIRKDVASTFDEASLPSLIVTTVLFFVLLFLPLLSLYIISR